jgi:predicted extracellular nuclease
MPHRTSRLIAYATVLALAASGLSLSLAVTAQAASPDIVISQVYGGGGNSGATLTNDFIELYNRGASAVDVTGWSVQYASAAGTTWQVTALDGQIPPGRHYLVQEAAGAGGTTPLPTPDASGSIAMSATSGKVALVTSATALTCGADCDLAAGVRDFVGYGGANDFETAAAPGLSNTTADLRAASGATDTDNNSADFTVGAPDPRNCGVDCEPPPPPAVPIHDIQGTSHLSPYDGMQVQTAGIATAVRAFGSARGFWMQDPEPDAEPGTSEGIFVFTGSATPSGVAVGDELTVTGTVDEFYPDASPANSVMLSTTELIGATWVELSSGNVVPAEPLGPTTVPDTYTPEPGGTIESSTLDPTTYALDFFESREGMRVQVTDARVVGPTTPFNELFVTTKPNQNPTPRGGTLYGGYDQQNSGRLLVQSLIPFAVRPFPLVNVGDHLLGVTAGPVDYSRFGGFMIQATELGIETSGGIQREITRPQRDFELAIATYNVENLDPSDPADKFARLAQGIVTNLSSPDIVALEEIQDNNGAVNDGTVAADQTLDMFTAAIVAAGGPQYEWRQIDPVDLADGGEPGGNIRVGFLFNPARVTFVDRPGGDATTAVQVLAGPNKKPFLSVSPGRIDPASSAWANSRKPLVGEFVFNDKTVFVVANHFNSKGGDQPLFGRFQPPERITEVQRLAQATEVREFVGAIQAFDPNANIVVLGDINDFEFSPTVDKLTEGGALTALMRTLPVDERYSYVFQGNSQTLDQILVGGRMKQVDYDVVHINAEFFDQASDHDPQVVRIKPGK